MDIKTFQTTWITSGIDNPCIDFTDSFGKYLATNGLSTSQIRNVFGELKRIQLKGIETENVSFLLLKPKIAYAIARAIKTLRNHQEKERKAFEAFRDIMNEAITVTQENEKTNPDRFQRFCDFFEAILAYHKCYGGKD
jgi:CRISPR-associated protein Csm2